MEWELGVIPSPFAPPPVVRRAGPEVMGRRELAVLLMTCSTQESGPGISWGHTVELALRMWELESLNLLKDFCLHPILLRWGLSGMAIFYAYQPHIFTAEGRAWACFDVFLTFGRIRGKGIGTRLSSNQRRTASLIAKWFFLENSRKALASIWAEMSVLWRRLHFSMEHTGH